MKKGIIPETSAQIIIYDLSICQQNLTSYSFKDQLLSSQVDPLHMNPKGLPCLLGVSMGNWIV